MTSSPELSHGELRASYPAIDLRARSETVVGRSRSCDVQLSHASISARHARLIPVDGGVELEDLDSRFGTAVNGVYLRRTKLKMGDLVRFGSASAYRYLGDRLQVEPDAQGMSVCLSEVRLLGEKGEVLLDDVNVELSPGSFTALLGPSGAGKSLFLGCLATTLQPDGVMDMLRGLARQGITIVTSTHTLDTLHYCDSALVLAPRDGATTIVFHGPPAELLPAFNVRDHADLFDLLARGVAGAEVTKPTGNAQVAISVRPKPGSSSGAPISDDVSLMNRPAASEPALESHVRQASVIARRSFRCFARDIGARRLAIVQPFALALLVVISQLTHEKSIIIHFFLVVAAIWLGMTLTVREIVRERPLYLRDRLAGLSPKAYIVGKLAIGAALAAAQGAALLLFARAIIPLFVSGGALAYFRDTNAAVSTLIIVLASIGGALMGLTISTLAKSEQAAIALLPLVILPQILFSRVTHGDAYKTWGQFDTPYVPLAKLPESRRDRDFKPAHTLLLSASLPMLSRPACAVLDMPCNRVDNLSRLLVVEWLYFLILLFGLGIQCHCVFLWREKQWRSCGMSC